MLFTHFITRHYKKLWGNFPGVMSLPLKFHHMGTPPPCPHCFAIPGSVRSTQSSNADVTLQNSTSSTPLGKPAFKVCLCLLTTTSLLLDGLGPGPFPADSEEASVLHKAHQPLLCTFFPL